MNKPVSCGFLVLNSKNEILACHPTGASFAPGCWNVPKGMKEADEKEDCKTAIRELEEETGLEYDVAVRYEFDPGVMPYLKNKDIHLLVGRIRYEDTIMKNVHCRSTFLDDRGYWIQEMDAFTFTSDLNMFSKCLRPVIEKILKDYEAQLSAKMED